MKPALPRARAVTCGLAAAILVSGCATPQRAQIEVLDAARAGGKSLAVVSDFHREHPQLEQRLARDLSTALERNGVRVAGSAAKADLVVLPTLGRMREAGPAPASAEPLSADARRLIGADRAGPAQGATLGRPKVPTALEASSAGRQRVGLLLTAVTAKDYLAYGVNQQVLDPVWRVYVSMPVASLSWNAAAKPLIDSAAAGVAAMPKGAPQGR